MSLSEESERRVRVKSNLKEVKLKSETLVPFASRMKRERERNEGKRYDNHDDEEEVKEGCMKVTRFPSSPPSFPGLGSLDTIIITTRVTLEKEEEDAVKNQFLEGRLFQAEASEVT